LARLSVELGETYQRIDARLNALDSFRFRLSKMALANWRRVFENVMRQETQRSLMIAAIALQRYQLRHGKFPPDLDSLAPEFLATVPVDYMNGQPLHYRVEPDGAFLLYSVGLDGKDDGGSPEPAAALPRSKSSRNARANLLSHMQQKVGTGILCNVGGKSFLRLPGRTVRNLHAVVSRKGFARLAAEDFVGLARRAR
jgi:hypothetical protein